MYNPVLHINKSVEEHMNDAQPTYIGPIAVRPPHGGLADIQYTSPIIIPPVNTDVRFAGLAPADILSHQNAMRDLAPTVPEEFNWRLPFSTDTPDIKRKKELISKPSNQALCGSCWG